MPAASSNLPEAGGPRHCFCSVLLRMGFTCAFPVTRKAVVSYTAFPPLPACTGGIFLLHFPGSRLHRTLSGILPYEARTFLVCGLSAPAAAIIHPALVPIYITIFMRKCKVILKDLTRNFNDGVTIHGLGAAHSSHSGRNWKFVSQNRPSLLNHVLTECAAKRHLLASGAARADLVQRPSGTITQEQDA